MSAVTIPLYNTTVHTDHFKPTVVLLQLIVCINQTEHLFQPHDQDAPQLLDTKVSSLLCAESIAVYCMLWVGWMFHMNNSFSGCCADLESATLYLCSMCMFEQ